MVHYLWTWEGNFLVKMQTLVSSISHSLFTLGFILYLSSVSGYRGLHSVSGYRGKQGIVYTDHKKPVIFSITVI